MLVLKFLIMPSANCSLDSYAMTQDGDARLSRVTSWKIGDDLWTRSVQGRRSPSETTRAVFVGQDARRIAEIRLRFPSSYSAFVHLSPPGVSPDDNDNLLLPRSRCKNEVVEGVI